MKRLALVVFAMCFTLHLIASVPFIVSGLQPDDKAVVSLSSYEFLTTMEVTSNGEYYFEDVPAGTHSLKIEAAGYNLPQAQTVIVAEDGSVKPAVAIELAVTKMSENPNEWTHSWTEDGSISGYTTTAYVNTPPEIEVLGKKIVPSDVPSQALLKQDYGVILSNEGLLWTQEHAYRLLETLKTIPGSKNNEYTTIISLTDKKIDDDIHVESIIGGKIVSISQDAFAYANPFLVNLDGVRGRFFSKRLHHALVKLITEFGQNTDKVNQILQERFGCSTSVPNIMAVTGEDAANFQDFYPTELTAIINMFEELPEGFHKTPQLKYLLRRQDGHPHPIYPEAAAVSWCTEEGYIEFINAPHLGVSAFGGNNEQFDTQRLILHEKAHFLWAFTFSDALKKDWADLGGWYQDPNSSSGWSTTKDVEFVSAYAHAHDPNEDMAESIAFYLKNPDALRSRSLPKYEFIRDRIMHGIRYISHIQDHLTFEVLNLWPDYDYPGKIKKVEISVSGAPDEDKELTFDIWLNHIEGFQDGASSAITRIASPRFIDDEGNMLGTDLDLWFGQVDGDPWHLRGTATISKYSKAGYWVPGDITVHDEVGNARYEGRNDCVSNIYVNNPLEDLVPPTYEKGSLQYELKDVEIEGHHEQLLTVKFKAYDNIGIRNVYGGLYTGVDSNHMPGWNTVVNQDDKTIEIQYRIKDYFYTTDYYIAHISITDIGGLNRDIRFSEDPIHEPIQTIHITTPAPDYEHPQVDLNRMYVHAEPTHPEAPDGETLVNITFYVRDNISGLSTSGVTLRDPQGLEHFYWACNGPSDNAGYFAGDPTAWRKYNTTIVLPQGSAPGIWGVSQMNLRDNAFNDYTYNFVETLIFEPDSTGTDYVLFSEMTDNGEVLIKLSSELDTGYGFTYRVIHEDSGLEINGEVQTKLTRAAEKAYSTLVDVSSLPYGKLIVITTVKDAEGNVVAVRSNTLNKERPTYLVTYMVDGEVYATEELPYGEVIILKNAPTKEGHTFSGWSEAPETMPASDVIISGTFTINKYLVTFKIGDEVIAADSLEYGATIVAPEAPEKEGHTFNGWGEVADSVPANDLTYEGSYSVNSYLLSYTVDSETIQADSVAYGTPITLLDEPEKEGHTFSGWSEAPETMPASDVIISGTFTINKYLVTFKIGDEVIAADSLEYGTTIVAPEAPEKEGHTFEGWGEVAETVPASDVTYEGTYTVNIYKVYYYVGEELVHTAEVAYGEAIPEYVYEPTKEGYTFLGWVGDTYETMPAHDVTYTANIDNGIRQLTMDNGQLTIYDLTGRKVLDTENLKGGIYIVNGKKVIVK